MLFLCRTHFFWLFTIKNTFFGAGGLGGADAGRESGGFRLGF